MKREELFKLIERNSGESIEESSKNGIMAHYVDVDGLIDDIQKALIVDLADVRQQSELFTLAEMKDCWEASGRAEFWEPWTNFDDWFSQRNSA